MNIKTVSEKASWEPRPDYALYFYWKRRTIDIWIGASVKYAACDSFCNLNFLVDTMVRKFLSIKNCFFKFSL